MQVLAKALVAEFPKRCAILMSGAPPGEGAYECGVAPIYSAFCSRTRTLGDKLRTSRGRETDWVGVHDVFRAGEGDGAPCGLSLGAPAERRDAALAQSPRLCVGSHPSVGRRGRPRVRWASGSGCRRQGLDCARGFVDHASSAHRVQPTARLGS
ncbi:uncharacterized protein SCHCODRAFT_02062189 [Schizophyllum commune H4-8]|uniref:uncharacterized protein n=1 Tax=Schizophyllum commune (strain H4-8 / FGSC 9210) TaxID=578458 RepID=UPI0021605B4F|nr:uncharacterized protein SCHCODRAFT_02062189 [Schizophyllum commune H4-8]KAI5888779.1 hypothetical protein SCHCODRAFT_02062189 [Schizophyllum commune H4-8]